jgi:(p)ppGpp synthase/HD superfamily hydrolase
MFSARMEAALGLVATRHREQTRRISGIPYWTHLVHVALILREAGESEDVQIAGLLHDVLEDTCRDDAEVATVAGEIEARFGRPVAEAVRGASEQKRDRRGKLPWRPRKEKFVVALENEATDLAVTVVAADKIHNVATFLADLDEVGEAIWQHFRAGPEATLWFYEAVATVVRTRRPGRLAADLDAEVERLRARLTPG